MSDILGMMNYDMDASELKGIFIDTTVKIMRPSINIGVKLEDDAIMPTYANSDDSGADLFCMFDTVIPANARGYIINTGVRLDIPIGFGVQIRPKSGVSANTPIRVILGTIDSGYKGVIGVIVDNISDEDILIPRGKAVAQMILESVPMMKLNVVDNLSESNRGEGGFGSTGRGI